VPPGLKALAAVPKEPIPLVVLTGFLGSGKTTFLGRVLASPDLADNAVVISEFGAVALDHLLLETESEGIVDLPNGCTCCAVRQGLADTLYRLVDRRRDSGRPPFRRIALETIVSRRSRADSLHALGRRLSRGVAASRPDRDDDRTRSRAPPAWRAFPRRRRRRPARTCSCSPRRTWRRRHRSCWRTSRRSTRSRARWMVSAIDAATGLVRRRPGRLAAAAPAHRSVHAHGITSLSIRLRRPMTRLEFASRWGGWPKSTAKACCA